ncbi:MAG: site-2 protease family protein [Cyanobacteria bacterium J06627_28]
MPLFNPSNILWSALVFATFGLSVCLHEFGHAIVAYWGGDHSVKEKGYLTLNPLRYTHLTNSIVLPFIFLLMGGIPLPGAAVYINHGSLKSRSWKSAVSAAGPLATLAVALLLAGIVAVLPAPIDFNLRSQDALLFEGVALLLTLEVAGVFLNLIPIPGLDGYGIIRPWLPVAIQQKLRPVAKYGVWILVGAFWFVPAFSSTFWGAVITVVQACGVPSDIAFFSLFRFQSGARVLFFFLLVFWIGYTQWKKRQPQDSENHCPDAGLKK